MPVQNTMATRSWYVGCQKTSKPWQWGIEHGYRLERRMVDSAGVDLPIDSIINSKIVIDSMLLPLPESAWEPLSDSSDMAGVAAGMIYGDSLDIISYDQAGFMDVINQNSERKNRHGFALFAADNDFETAEAMGVGYIDNTVLTGRRYVYTVTLNGVPANTKLLKGTASINTDTSQALPTPQNMTAIAGDSTVLLTWSKDALGDHYTSYCVEVSYDNGVSFQPAHDLPLVFAGDEQAATNVMFQDSLPANGVTYIYRVKGKSPFGVLGPVSDTIHVVGRPGPLGVNPGIQTVQELNTGMLTINWEFPTELESKINGFDVYRSDKVKGEYTKINSGLLSVTTRSYEDVNPGHVNYYKVFSEDENGYPLESNAMLGQPNDSIPPSVPVGLVGESDENGLVTLRWNKNTEEDLLGYRVFISNTPLGEFAQITSLWINDTVFSIPDQSEHN